ncbi:putative uncharacterized protein encoded by MAPKAPK5-AS1 [Kogia breviceps]|uniref:putative uncharacterized protein encoded by MAPKAPK5-AS1 n=1 Tax=Kogia breviceps TaxID=27615 RepID=UPI0034D1B909
MAAAGAQGKGIRSEEPDSGNRSANSAVSKRHQSPSGRAISSPGGSGPAAARPISDSGTRSRSALPGAAPSPPGPSATRPAARSAADAAGPGRDSPPYPRSPSPRATGGAHRASPRGRALQGKQRGREAESIEGSPGRPEAQPDFADVSWPALGHVETISSH